MDAPKKKRKTVADHRQVIEANRRAKGWTVEELARKAELSVETVARAEAGREKYVSTMSRIAKALGIDVALITAPPAASSEPVPVWEQPVIIVVMNVDRPTVSRPEGGIQMAALNFLNSVMRELGPNVDSQGRRPTPFIVTEGSLIITTFFRSQDVDRLCDLFLRGALASLSLKSIETPPPGPRFTEAMTQRIQSILSSLYSQGSGGYEQFRFVSRLSYPTLLQFYRGMNAELDLSLKKMAAATGAVDDDDDDEL